MNGGGSGLGKHIAAAFNEAGAKAVVILGRREGSLREAAADLKESGNARILFFAADVTDEGGVERGLRGCG